MTKIYFYKNKVLLANDMVAIDKRCCCIKCCCPYLDIDILKEDFGGFSNSPEFGDVNRPPCPNPETWDDYGPYDPECNPDTMPQIGNPCRPFPEPCDWSLVPACLRWVCRCVDEDLDLICEEIYGGPSINDKDLSQLVIDAKGAETEAGCYVYTIEFFGWYDKNKIGGWVSSDDMYSVNKVKLDESYCVADCSECFDSCCIHIMGKNLCAPSTVVNGDITESWWFDTLSFSYWWMRSNSATGLVEYIRFIPGVCDGKEYGPSLIDSGSYNVNVDGPGTSIEIQYRQAIIGTNEDTGCPTSIIDLGPIDATACGLNGCGSTTPVTPVITWVCT